MTIEEKAKAYDEAIEKGRIFRDHLLETGEKGIAGEIEYIFPELDKSEDERVKKRILLSLEKDLMATKNSGCDTQDLEQCIAWLEKQGSEQKPILDFKARNWHVSKVDGKIHDMTYNPTDKVEPKFKVGDWVVNRFGDVWHIDSFDSKNYQVSNGDKYCYFPIKKQNEMHLWTIEDAKRGDVVTDKSDGTICIFQSIGHHPDGGSYNDPSYCFLYCRYDDGYFFADFEDGNIMTSDDVIPATKEQRDLLFQKMKEAGYEWDEEKKELKKMEQESVETPRDYHDIDPHFGISIEDLMSKKNSADKVEPIFSIGDVLCDKSCTTLNKKYQPIIEILDIRNGMYICNNCSFPISQQDEYELVTKKNEPQYAWSDEEEIEIPFGAKDSKLQEVTYYIPKGFHAEIDDDKVVIKKGEKSAAWSDEDEKYFQSLENACAFQFGRDSAITNWLKSIKNRIGG